MRDPAFLPRSRERIFDRFMRLKSGADANHEGSGLGLAICRGHHRVASRPDLCRGGSGDRGLCVCSKSCRVG